MPRVPFPIGGLQEGLPAQDQEIGTSPILQNVRPYDAEEERIRGGQRPGTVLAYTTQIVGDHPIVAMTQVVTTYIQPEV